MTKKQANRKRKLQKRASAVARHADYEAQQRIIQAPFGRAFKTGGHQTSPKDISRKSAKQNLRRCLD